MAQFDLSPFQQVKPRSIDDYNAMADEADARRMSLLQGQMQFQDTQRARDEDKAIRALYADPNFDINDPTGQRRAMQTSPKAAQALIKANLDAKKTAGEIAATNADTITKSMAIHRNQLDAVGSREQAAQWLAAQYADPVLGPVVARYGTLEQQLKAIPPDGTDDFLKWKQAKALGAEKFIEQNKPTTTVLNNGGANQVVQTPGLGGAPQTVMTTTRTQSPDSVASNATAMRGQNMADARARESTAAAMTKPFEVTGPDGVPTLVQQDKQGNIIPVPGFGPKTGASKPLTEGQAKANLFGTRMQEAHDVLSTMAEKGVTRPSLLKQGAGAVPLIGGGLEILANAAASPEQQQVEQAQRDFVNAVLRRESGAAIAPSEFASAERQYFPQPGDKSEVIAQKKRNRETAIQGLMAEVPVGARTKPVPLAKPAAATPAGRPPLSAFEGK